MKTLIVMVGLPRAGKSTWIREHFGGTIPIVNPDSIRLALHGQRYIVHAEPFIWAIAPVMVKALFLAGHETVIVDACHISKKRRDPWKSEEWKTVFQSIPTPAATCIARAKSESDWDILPIIEKMAGESEPLLVDEELLNGPGEGAYDIRSDQTTEFPSHETLPDGPRCYSPGCIEPPFQGTDYCGPHLKISMRDYQDEKNRDPAKGL